MSISYWMIEGIGINMDKVEPFLNKEKLAHMLLEQLPDDEKIITIVENKVYSQLDVRDFLYGNPFGNLAELLIHCDKTDSITYGDNGEGGVYFYYPPSMPWRRTEAEPDSVEEVHRRIIMAVKVVTDLSDEEIEAMIDDDLHVVGVG